MDNVVYLIDYENVSYKGLYGISNVKPVDEIIIFYSNDISIIRDIISIYESAGIVIKYYQLDKTGKNALDFMISAYAGYAASKENINKIAVISNDKGYSSIIPVIKSINPDTELVFDCCIHNILFPDDRKEIVITAAHNAEKNTPGKSTEQPKTNTVTSSVISSASGNTPNQKSVTKETIKNHLQNNIPSKYINQVVALTWKSLNNGSTEKQFSALMNSCFGTKQDTTQYKKFAISYFKKLIMERNGK